MKYRLLVVACVVSLLLLGTLACGYFGQLGLFLRPRAPALGGIDTFSTFQIGYGQVSFMSMKRPTPPGQTFLSPGVIHPSLQFKPFRPPTIRRCLWQFHARRLHGDFGASALMIDCPIWCAAAPLFIAPALWLQKRRKSRRAARGFSVIEVSR